MKYLFLILLSVVSFSQDHSHHPKHGMVLIGDSSIYASHIVYKDPHNVQVLLKINFNEAAKQKYFETRISKPTDLLIFVLDSMDIKEITKVDSLIGSLMYEDQDGTRHMLLKDIQLQKKDFEVLYFSELPLSLKSDK